MCLTIQTSYYEVNALKEVDMRGQVPLAMLDFKDEYYTVVEERCTKRAEQDIVCYKILTVIVSESMYRDKIADIDRGIEVLARADEGHRVEFYSPFQNFNFRLGELYKDDRDVGFQRHTIRDDYLKIFRTYLAEGVFHTFVTPDAAKRGLDSVGHASISHNIDRNITNIKNVVVKCIIPKGTVYYYGVFDDVPSYASKALVPVEVMDYDYID